MALESYVSPLYSDRADNLSNQPASDLNTRCRVSFGQNSATILVYRPSSFPDLCQIAIHIPLFTTTEIKTS